MQQDIKYIKNMTDMKTPPFRTSSGGIGCPRCSTTMKKGNAPFYLHSEYVGVFESLVCPICNYSALTEKGYEKAILVAKSMGIVGIIEDTPETISTKLMFDHYGIGKNDTQIMKEKEPNEALTWDIVDVFYQQPLMINRFTKKTLIKTH